MARPSRGPDGLAMFCSGSCAVAYSNKRRKGEKRSSYKGRPVGDGWKYRRGVANAYRSHIKRGYRLSPCEECGCPSAARFCGPCGKAIAVKATADWKWERQKGKVRQCRVCERLFCLLRGARGSICSDECRAHNEWRVRKQGKMRRKTRMKGQSPRVVSIYRNKVFERDNWQCVACGTQVPERLAGTFDAQAPEVDHIVPVSKGGPHTYENVQTLCRSCNILKSNGADGRFKQVMGAFRGLERAYRQMPG